ncbi:hypothetical protein YTPLAS18_13900 [Nitrospira sp.]|nr:hypothetical protein YTPLAS18_13900 [Nitrospira sp.]
MALVPDAMAEYAIMGKTIYHARRDSDDQGAPNSPEQKNGRNESCPCSSGRKFKRCCGAS